jgi:hypothetical protein
MTGARGEPRERDLKTIAACMTFLTLNSLGSRPGLRPRRGPQGRICPGRQTITRLSDTPPRPARARVEGRSGLGRGSVGNPRGAREKNGSDGPPRPSIKADPFIAKTLAHWKVDPDLVDIRDEPELAKLPEAEREPLRSLRADVEALRKKAEVRAAASR